MWDGKAWDIDKSKTKVEARSTQTGKDGASKAIYVDADPAGRAADRHPAPGAIACVKAPVGGADFRMNTFFADVGDPGAIQIVNQAQADYVKSYIRGQPAAVRDLPVLSVSAPFKSGFEGGTATTPTWRWATSRSSARPASTCTRTRCMR